MIVSGVLALPFDDSAGFTAPPAFGPFRVLHQIGSGALGPVFRTFEPQLEKLVAVKAFRLEVVPEVIAQLGDALRRLVATPVPHQGIVPVVDAGLEGTTAFLAVEYIAAETLDVSLRHMAPARVETALPLLRQMADAIEAAWAVGLGHGALHPRDIFVMPATRPDTENDEPGASRIRIAGFGVVPALESLRILAPVRRPYTAPERAEGQPWDIRADVYSLGVIAHELLTGRRPAGSNVQGGELAAETSAEQRVAIRRALSAVLAADPARRFATPTAFVDALTTGDRPAVGGDVVVEVAARPEPEPALVLEPQGESAPEPEPEPAPEWSPAATDDRSDGPVVPLNPLPAVTPFRFAESSRQPIADPSTAPRRGLLVALVLLAIVGGTMLGYWWRGRGPAEGTVVATEAPPAADSPIGTEVPVAGVASAAAAPQAVRPPVAPPPAPEARRGRLLVRSVPAGALVSVNGRARGTTPATIRDLPFGTYNVAVSRSGYQRRVQRVTVSKAVPARELTVELASAAPLAPAATTGSVYVETRPGGATVSIDGRRVGTAPMRVPELAPGPHTIRVDLAGHKSVTTTTVVRAGQQTRVRLSLEIQ